MINYELYASLRAFRGRDHSRRPCARKHRTLGSPVPMAAVTGA